QSSTMCAPSGNIRWFPNASRSTAIFIMSLLANWKRSPKPQRSARRRGQADQLPQSCSSSSPIPQIVNSHEPSDSRGEGERIQPSDSFGPRAPIENEDDDD